MYHIVCVQAIIYFSNLCIFSQLVNDHVPSDGQYSIFKLQGVRTLTVGP